jgi:hypothetical protein
LRRRSALVFVTVCVAIGLLAATYTVVKADPNLIRLDLLREGPYRQSLSSDFTVIEASASEVVELCAQNTTPCLAAANRLDLSVRGFWEDLARTPPPPCLASTDGELRHDTEMYDTAARAILADSGTQASDLEAIASIASTQPDVERILHLTPRCGLARLSVFLPSN